MAGQLTTTHATRETGEIKPVYDDETGLERLVFFSDAVFAIAITLLALEIRLPALEGELSNEALLAALNGLWPRYLAYGISFLAIGLYWLVHHRTFRAVERYDARLLMLNLVALAGIAFMPFPTTVISEHANRVGTQFYALVAAGVGLLMAAIWWCTHGGGRVVGRHSSRGDLRRGV